VPGNARAADRWSGRNAGLPVVSEGCALSGCQQAVAHWPGRSRPAQGTCQRRQLHALVRGQDRVLVFVNDLLNNLKN